MASAISSHRLQMVRSHIQSLPHQEGHIFNLQVCLDLVAVHQLPGYQGHGFFQKPVELIQVAIGADGNTRQVDGCKGEVSPAIADGRSVAVGDHAGAAAHIGHFAVKCAVLGSIHKREGGIHAGGRGTDGQLEQVIIRVAGI